MLDELYKKVDRKDTWRPIFTPLQNHFLNWLLLAPLLPLDWAKLIINTIRYGADPTYFVQPPPKQDQVKTNCKTEEELFEALKCVQNNMCLKNSGNSTLSGPYSSKAAGKIDIVCPLMTLWKPGSQKWQAIFHASKRNDKISIGGNSPNDYIPKLFRDCKLLNNNLFKTERYTK